MAEAARICKILEIFMLSKRKIKNYDTVGSETMNTTIFTVIKTLPGWYLCSSFDETRKGMNRLIADELFSVVQKRPVTYFTDEVISLTIIR